jgi:hypothetical protein
MKYVLIMTAYYSYQGGVAIHSIKFNDEAAAYAAGDKWRNAYQTHTQIYCTYVVVEMP